MKNCSIWRPPASHQAMPTRNGYVPVPPIRPVVSVSRKSHWMGRRLLAGRWVLAGVGRNHGLGRRVVRADGFGEPFADGEMLAEIVCGGGGFEHSREAFGAVG